MSGEAIPALLTVEEAGELLRIGRTKAYAMTREWRETGGRSGLPVVDLGHVLRVPRRALEDLIGTELTDVEISARTEVTRQTAPPAGPPEPRTSNPTEVTPTRQSPTTQPTRRRKNRIANQLDLFDSHPTSN